MLMDWRHSTIRHLPFNNDWEAMKSNGFQFSGYSRSDTFLIHTTSVHRLICAH